MRLVLGFLLFVIVSLAFSIAVARGGYLSDAEQARSRTFWPRDVPFPAGLKAYSFKTQDTTKAYKAAKTEDDRPVWWMYGARPALILPPVPGGMDKIVPGRSFSIFWIWIPHGTKVRVEHATAIDGKGQEFERLYQSFPVGTLSVDLACAIEGRRGWPFELRYRMKVHEDGWREVRRWRDTAVAPPGYEGPGKACAECHGKAVENDGVFSWRPFKDNLTTYQGVVHAEIDRSMLEGWER